MKHRWVLLGKWSEDGYQPSYWRSYCRQCGLIRQDAFYSTGGKSRWIGSRYKAPYELTISKMPRCKFEIPLGG